MGHSADKHGTNNFSGETGSNLPAVIGHSAGGAVHTPGDASDTLASKLASCDDQHRPRVRKLYIISGPMVCVKSRTGKSLTVES